MILIDCGFARQEIDGAAGVRGTNCGRVARAAVEYRATDKRRREPDP